MCESEEEGNRHLGETRARALRNRLADCDAASSVTELLVGHPTELSDGTMRVELDVGSSLIFTANHPDVPMTISGQVDWAKVHSIRVLRIEDRNERS